MVANKNHYEIISSINRFEIDYSRSSKDLMNEIKNKLNDFGSKKIGVELSGGLDSSLIIEALLNIGIDFPVAKRTTYILHFCAGTV